MIKIVSRLAFLLRTFLITLPMATAWAAPFSDDFSSNTLALENWSSPGGMSLAIEPGEGKDGSNGLGSNINASSNNAASSRNNLRFISGVSSDPLEVTSLVKLKTIAFSNNTEAVFARVSNIFYTTEASWDPNDLTGQVWAALYLGDRGDGLEAWWRVERSLDATFSTSENIGEGTLIAPDDPNFTLEFETFYLLWMDFDATTLEFTFHFGDENGNIFVQQTQAGPTLGATAVGFPARLTSGIDFSDGGDGSSASIGAIFDNAIIYWDNGASSNFDDFEGDVVDEIIWQEGGMNRYVDVFDQKMGLTITTVSPGTQSQYRHGPRLSDQNQNCLAAKVLLPSDGGLIHLPQPDQVGQLRLEGFLYNDGTNPDVYGAIRLEQQSDGSRRASFYLGTNQGNTQIDSHIFPMEINLDQQYFLALELDPANNIVRALIDDEVHEYIISTPINPTLESFKRIAPRIRDTVGNAAEGSFTAEIDDVYSGDTCSDYPFHDDDFLLLILPAIISGANK